LEYKQAIIDDSFRKIKNKLENTEIKPILASPKIREYRNKIEFSFGKYMVLNKDNLDISGDNNKLSDKFKCVYDWNL
jgi:tRNA/tmRNA/rRNA uracil-C5-methylase (TrmA/RlmC/RlmD family)